MHLLLFYFHKQMKKNLSTEALKGFRKENGTTPSKRRNQDVSEAKHNVPPLQVISRYVASIYHRKCFGNVTWMCSYLTLGVTANIVKLSTILGDARRPRDPRHLLPHEQVAVGPRRKHATETDRRGGKQGPRLQRRPFFGHQAAVPTGIPGVPTRRCRAQKLAE